MTREAIRPFTKVVRIQDALPHTIELRDLAGDLLKSNYITVQAVSGAAPAGIFLACPSGLLAPSSSADTFVASSIVGVASGSIGLAAPAAGGSVVLGLFPFDSVESVVISQSIVQDQNYIVSYGNVTLTNTRADNAARRGK